eukprot:COSAG02_NODE_34_length_49821_cov_105.420438_36_plen_76_part_00
MTPLFIASEHQLTKMVLELLKLGADPNYVRKAMDVCAPVVGCPRHDGPDNIETNAVTLRVWSWMSSSLEFTCSRE